MPDAQLIKNLLNHHMSIVEEMHNSAYLVSTIQNVIDNCVKAISAGQKILFCGNGGSASDSQHIATELTVRFKKDRPAIAALALTTDTSALTAAGNDLGFDRIFSRQIEALGQPGDVLIGFSTSGNSANVIMAFEEAKRRDITTVFLGGGTGGALLDIADVSIIVPSTVTAHIQECHIMIGHIICEGVETGLGYAA
jgi:D-sedoheptulose 7-phosphate isomerase